jgi:hypothetical protein
MGSGNATLNLLLMNRLKYAPLVVAVFLASSALAADSVPTLKDQAEQAAWDTIAARFASAPSVKTDTAKTLELAVTGLKNDPKGGAATASITLDKASGRVVAVTSNGAKISDAEMAGFAAFAELSNITLWHNSGAGFTGTGLKGVANLPKLDRVTLAGGSFDDAGMADAAKLPRLRELRAWHSKFTDAGVAAFRNHPALESIAIGPMWEKALTDKSLESLATCPKLKKFSISETWLTWDGGLKHLTKLKGQMTDVDFGNCIIEPADVERLRQEMPGTKIVWKGLGAGKEELQKAWIRPKAEKWIPKELLDRVMASAVQ